MITASAGIGGTITPSGAVLVNTGAQQSFSITPETGYHIVDVLLDDISQGAQTSLDCLMFRPIIRLRRCLP
jgi:hypothetical protein